jgi:DNA-binding response OmpR family regulator
MRMRILLAEDQPKVAAHLARGLREAGYAVDVAADGEEALWLAAHHPYDALVLDVMMPGKDGISVIRQLRRDGVKTPAIMASAKGEVQDRIHGLDAGADDYLVKPFSLAELLARLRAILRRQRPELLDILRIGDLEIDLRSRKVKRGERMIELTKREFALLEFLAIASPEAVPKTAIVERVWDQHFDSGTNVVNVYIRYLRGKLEQEGESQILHTVRGVGFALRAQSP